MVLQMRWGGNASDDSAAIERRRWRHACLYFNERDRMRKGEWRGNLDRVTIFMGV